MRSLEPSRVARHGARSSTGITLLEVLVALVILSVGMLGLAGLQAAGLSANGDAEQRTQAALVTNDMIERMRANPAAVNTGGYAAVDWGAIDCAAAPDPFCADRGAAAGACNAAQMAVFDAFVVRCGASDRLAAASVEVQCTDNSGTAKACADTPFRTLIVGWQSANGGADGDKSIATTVRP
jgi:type IV pilus assembly protein PilV